MNQNQPPLIERPRRRLKQPTKDALREQLAVAADEIIRLREENERLQRRPWWRRILRKATHG